MGPTKGATPKLKSWSEINKLKKAERRKWKEENLKKKLEKQKVKRQVEPEPVEENVNKTLSTLSIAVPGSILENAQSPELRTYLAGQIARAACIFQVDEVIVFDDYCDEANATKSTLEDDYGEKTIRQCCVQLGRILQYLECPQYLRKHFFPLHKDLRFSGLLNPLNAPHHLSRSDNFLYREGVVLNKPTKPGTSIINVGLLKEVHVKKSLTPGLRCTVKLLPEISTKTLKGQIVSSATPRQETGVYWGYNVRLASNLSQVFSQSPYENGYDLTIGTSDKGTLVDDFQCTPYKHLLVMFGGLHGLEAALENDDKLNADDPKLLFDYYLNTLPGQGSKTIRTEEAILVSLASLRPKLTPETPAKPFEETMEFCHQQEKETTSNEDMSRFD